MHDLQKRAQCLLERWAGAADSFWTPVGSDGLSSFGPGYQHWGVQSGLNYVAALATLAAQENTVRPDFWRQRALSVLRHSLATHVTGDRPGTEGRQWGNNWISMLGLERAMHGVAHLEALMTTQDRTAWQRLLLKEAAWLMNPDRGGAAGINAGLWASEGKNNPESNIWSGAFLWRMATLFPDHPRATEWREQAHRFLINGVSIPADAGDQQVIAGQPVVARHAGANFFPNYALDHHGYLNVGYMVICVSNVAMLHFDLRKAGHEPPQSLYHHQRDLWQVLRRFIFEDGRLARIGGDSRVRYAYCQEYLLPALLFAADYLDDPHALELLSGQIGLMEREAGGGEVLFYGRRVEWLRQHNPHYYSRLESDRACALAMLLNYAPLVQLPAVEPVEPLAQSLSGSWMEEEHGAVMHRSPTRLASFVWRARGLTQAICLPPDASDLAEWFLNLAPVVRFIGNSDFDGGNHRRLLDYQIQSFDGGFVTSGSVMEGVNIRLDEGAQCTDQAVTQLAFAAPPDDHTCLCLQYVRAAADRVVYLAELKSLNLVIPNDVFNDYRRVVYGASGEAVLTSPPELDEVVELNSGWINLDDRLGLVSLTSDAPLVVERSTERRAGHYKSLYTEIICQTCQREVRRCQPGEILVDTGFAVLAGVDSTATAAVCGSSLEFADHEMRGVWVTGQDKKDYALVANWGTATKTVKVFGRQYELPAGGARLIARG